MDVVRPHRLMRHELKSVRTGIARIIDRRMHSRGLSIRGFRHSDQARSFLLLALFGGGGSCSGLCSLAFLFLFRVMPWLEAVVGVAYLVVSLCLLCESLVLGLFFCRKGLPMVACNARNVSKRNSKTILK